MALYTALMALGAALIGAGLGYFAGRRSMWRQIVGMARGAQ